MTVELWLGDCLVILPEIEDNSIDAIIADNPYGVSGCKWDSIIPIDELWFHYSRVIRRPNGVIVLNGTQPFITTLINGKIEWFKYCYYWIKNRQTNFMMSANMPLRDAEELAVFSPGAIAHANLSSNRMTYNPQGLIECGINRKSLYRESGLYSSTLNRPSLKKAYTQKYTNYPGMILNYDAETGLHPTQKPEGLIERMVLTYTNEGYTVLDNAMGSGTTGVACVKNNRNFIGIEIEEEYFDKAYNRIEGAM